MTSTPHPRGTDDIIDQAIADLEYRFARRRAHQLAQTLEAALASIYTALDLAAATHQKDQT